MFGSQPSQKEVIELLSQLLIFAWYHPTNGNNLQLQQSTTSAAQHSSWNEKFLGALAGTSINTTSWRLICPEWGNLEQGAGPPPRFHSSCMSHDPSGTASGTHNPNLISEPMTRLMYPKMERNLCTPMNNCRVDFYTVGIHLAVGEHGVTGPLMDASTCR